MGLVDEALDVLGQLPAVHLFAELVELPLDLCKKVRDAASLAGALALRSVAGAGGLQG